MASMLNINILRKFSRSNRYDFTFTLLHKNNHCFFISLPVIFLIALLLGKPAENLRGLV